MASDCLGDPAGPDADGMKARHKERGVQLPLDQRETPPICAQYLEHESIM